MSVKFIVCLMFQVDKGTSSCCWSMPMKRRIVPSGPATRADRISPMPPMPSVCENRYGDLIARTTRGTYYSFDLISDTSGSVMAMGRLLWMQNRFSSFGSFSARSLWTRPPETSEIGVKAVYPTRRLYRRLSTTYIVLYLSVSLLLLRNFEILVSIKFGLNSCQCKAYLVDQRNEHLEQDDCRTMGFGNSIEVANTNSQFAKKSQPATRKMAIQC